MERIIRIIAAIGATLALACVTSAAASPKTDNGAPDYGSAVAKAQRFLRVGALLDAIAAADAVDAASPGRADVQAIRAYALCRLGRLDEAEQAAEAAQSTASGYEQPVVVRLLKLIADRRANPDAPFPAMHEASAQCGAARKGSAVPQAGVTGVIIMASGLGISRELAPRIRRADGREVWRTQNVDPDFILGHGAVAYAHSIAEARLCDRAGRAPLVFKAVGAGRVGPALDPEIASADAAKMVYCNQLSGFLDRNNVVFVVDDRPSPRARMTTGAADGVTVEPADAGRRPAQTGVPGADTAASGGTSITGVIIIARGFGIQRDMAPKIRRSDGTEVWGTKSVDPDYVLEHGIVAYAHSVDEARASARAGRSPLILNAVAAWKASPSTDPEIADVDAEMLLRFNQQAGFLDRNNVIFVIDD
jgi:catechol 2,3-dioxygenase-like lactoylglutathione lyase family enzyme